MKGIGQKLEGFKLFFIDIVKWLFLAGLTGCAVGAVASGFIFLLVKACGLTERFEYYYLFLPAALFLSGAAVKHLAPDAEGHGTEKAIQAVHNQNGKIKLGVVPVKIAATVVTIAAGGSAGKEGPTTQIGAGIASFIAGVFRLSDKDRKRLVICGMGAAFAAIFGAPVAAAVFAAEVLVVGRLNLKNIFSIMTASVAGYLVYAAIGAGGELMPQISLVITPANAPFNLSFALFSGIFFGLAALMTIFAVNGFHKLSEGLKIYKPLKGLIGGTALVILVFIFGSDYLGMGIEYFMNVASGAEARFYDFILKIIFTAITLSFCGSGGILTPLMFIGMTAGSAFAAVFNLDPTVFACLGFLAVLAGATNTPLACIIMAFEMFASPSLALMAAIACPVAYLVTGHRSVYPTQMLRESKISSIWIESLTAKEPIEKALK
ncbi:MAG: chloride channel protein [Clostridiales bacterium]|jgi:H+/Cl- antiporter ClcA|nr:chloride channel protein [Clostridiales bacterium]